MVKTPTCHYLLNDRKGRQAEQCRRQKLIAPDFDTFVPLHVRQKQPLPWKINRKLY
jgi:hypothetical protein